MKTIFSLFICFLAVQFSSAQNNRHYLVKFTDKTHTPYSLDKPEEFLSAKAIERRRKQNIAVNTSDLPVDLAYVALVKATGVNIVRASKWLNAVSVSTSDESKITAVRQLNCVKEVILTADEAAPKLASKFDPEKETGIIPMERSPLNYGPSFFQVNQIGIVCMHNNGFMGQGMTIAVLDAGFFKADSLPAFDTLRINNQILGCRDMVTGDTMVFEDFPHGMNVLSCMGGNLPGQLIGTAPKAKFWLIRTEDAYSETLQEEVNWLNGAEFADSVGADIINSSLGYSKFDGGIGDHYYSDMDGNTTIVTNAADWAASKGIFVTTSAGNSGGFPWYKITAPADADSSFTVGAVDSAGLIASFSGRGLTFDGRIKPDGCARGVQTVIAANTGGITTSGGTSFSSPLTAGAVACLWQANPSATNMQLVSAIQQSSTQAMSPDSVYGYGIPDFCKADSILSFMLSVNEKPPGEQGISVYPNPFSSGFQVTYYASTKEELAFALFDISGRKIFSDTHIASPGMKNNFVVKTGDELSPGVYMLQITTAQKIYFEKIIKQ